MKQTHLSLLSQDGVQLHRMIGFEEVGGVDTFKTAALEAALARHKIIRSARAPPAEDTPVNSPCGHQPLHTHALSAARFCGFCFVTDEWAARSRAARGARRRGREPGQGLPDEELSGADERDSRGDDSSD